MIIKLLKQNFSFQTNFARTPCNTFKNFLWIRPISNFSDRDFDCFEEGAVSYKFAIFSKHDRFKQTIRMKIPVSLNWTYQNFFDFVQKKWSSSRMKRG